MRSEKLAELLGNSMGDGSLEYAKRKRFQLRGHETEDREHYQKFIIPTFNEIIALPLAGKTVGTITDHKRNSYGISIESKVVVEFLKNHGLPTGDKKELSIPVWIRQNEKFLKAFLRGLFDTDGSIYFSKNYSAKSNHHKATRLVLGMTSKKLINQIHKSLLSMGFHPYLIKPFKSKTNKRYAYRVQISKKEDIIKWVEEIGFSNSKHMTKYLIRIRYGFCPPLTTIQQRKDILENKLDPKSFYAYGKVEGLVS